MNTFPAGLSTDHMRTIRSWMWIGDALREAAKASSTARSILLHRDVIHYIVNHMLMLKCKPLGFRKSTRSERRLSRFYDSFTLLKSMSRHNRSAHLTILVEMPNKRQAQLMVSSTLDCPMCMECIDVDRVRCIRFHIWLASQLRKKYAFDESFVVIWCSTVLPLHNNEPTMVPVQIHERPWDFSKIGS